MSSSFKKIHKKFTISLARVLYILLLINLLIYNYMLLSLYVISILYSIIHNNIYSRPTTPIIHSKYDFVK